VWFGGKFISHSTQAGFGVPPIAVDKLVPPCGNFERRKPVSLASGVGNNPEAIPPVRRVNGVSRDTMPLRIIPERAELAEDDVQSARSKDRTILEDDKPWPYFGDEADNLAPQAALASVCSRHATGETDVLAREAATDRIRGNSIGSKLLAGKLAHVMIEPNLWPVVAKNKPRKLLDLAERDGFEAARSLQTKREPADAAEQVK
jgi:hypothetical protein